jgi:hypothetical protein
MIQRLFGYRTNQQQATESVNTPTVEYHVLQEFENSKYRGGCMFDGRYISIYVTTGDVNMIEMHLNFNVCGRLFLDEVIETVDSEKDYQVPFGDIGSCTVRIQTEKGFVKLAIIELSVIEPKI